MGVFSVVGTQYITNLWYIEVFNIYTQEYDQFFLVQFTCIGLLNIFVHICRYIFSMQTYHIQCRRTTACIEILNYTCVQPHVRIQQNIHVTARHKPHRTHHTHVVHYRSHVFSCFCIDDRIFILLHLHHKSVDIEMFSRNTNERNKKTQTTPYIYNTYTTSFKDCQQMVFTYVLYICRVFPFDCISF